MGVGRDPNTPPGSKDAAGWVLVGLSRGRPTSTAMIAAGCEDVEAVLALGITPAMNRTTRRAGS